MQGRADLPARVVVLGAVEVRRVLICLDRNQHFDPASIIKDQGPNACNEALLHEIDERGLRAALKTVQDNLSCLRGAGLSDAHESLRTNSPPSRAQLVTA